MGQNESSGQSTFEWVRSHYDETEMKCAECGYVDEEGSWTSEANGKEIVYRHECPSCEAVRVHTFSLGE
ncbi:HVO_0649 family zinc finger protein [Halomarina rubra]|uniref:HVO_0649 family zinc finger protein n=1 Tax=Halomarina rubra TaxID=2071873 RepID=A0ABD6AWW7_9EURY|nr:HVO_0649 family zinc finger protein [Halomarina rubra]